MIYPSRKNQTSNKLNYWKYAFLILICFPAVQVVWSQSYTDREGDSINPRFYLWAGWYNPNMNTSLRVDTKIGIGTEISLEDNLNLSETLGVFRLDGTLRLSKNSQLVYAYTGIKRNNSLVLEKDIEFGDTIFKANSGVDFKFNVDYIAATYRYHFFNERNWNAGFSAGLRGVFISAGMDARLNDRRIIKEADLTAPALLLGAHGSAYLTPRLLARYSLEFLYLKINDIKVNIVESNASVHYFIFKNVGLGLAYSTNNYRLRDLPLWKESKGKVNFEFGGLNLFLTSRF